MCASSWKLYVYDFSFFWFLSSSSRTRGRAGWSLGDDGATNHLHHHRQLQTAQARVLDELGRNQKIKITQFTRWWALWFRSSCSRLLQKGFIPTTKNAKKIRFWANKIIFFKNEKMIGLECNGKNNSWEKLKKIKPSKVPIGTKPQIWNLIESTGLLSN